MGSDWLAWQWLAEMSDSGGSIADDGFGRVCSSSNGEQCH